MGSLEASVFSTRCPLPHDVRFRTLSVSTLCPFPHDVRSCMMIRFLTMSVSARCPFPQDVRFHKMSVFARCPFPHDVRFRSMTVKTQSQSNSKTGFYRQTVKISGSTLVQHTESSSAPALGGYRYARLLSIKSREGQLTVWSAGTALTVGDWGGGSNNDPFNF